ncbi:MAG: NYN domain-containing protein [Devosia sp.]|jgi:uncharacterized LabA/DUF88 family protein
MKRVALLIDGGHLRVVARTDGIRYDADFVERFAKECVDEDEQLLRVLYYDCAPYSGTVKLPVSGEDKVFEGNDGWLKSLAARDLFAVRRGVLKFRGFKPRQVPISGRPLSDDDFKPDFEQKGVDMRIGLDMATFSEKRSVDRIILVSGDTDCVPAMKHARIAGLQLVLIELPGHRLAPELTWHTDIRRAAKWPA